MIQFLILSLAVIIVGGAIFYKFKFQDDKEQKENKCRLDYFLVHYVKDSHQYDYKEKHIIDTIKIKNKVGELNNVEDIVNFIKKNWKDFDYYTNKYKLKYKKNMSNEEILRNSLPYWLVEVIITGEKPSYLSEEISVKDIGITNYSLYTGFDEDYKEIQAFNRLKSMGLI